MEENEVKKEHIIDTLRCIKIICNMLIYMPSYQCV